MTITTEVENFPGFPEPIQGGELMQRMRDQAQNVGVQMIDDTITEIDFEHRPFVCSSENANSFVGDSLIIATGASARWLGLPSEEKFRGFGVSACATCDGFFYRNRNVAVVGGGNSALEEALYLTILPKTSRLSTAVTPSAQTKPCRNASPKITKSTLSGTASSKKSSARKARSA